MVSLPRGTHIGYIELRVANLERSLEFYEQSLGFRVVERSDLSVQLSATGAKPDHIILKYLRGARPRPRPSTGLFHVAIRLPNEPALASVLSRLVKIRAKIHGYADHGVSEAVYLADPEGNGIELYTDRPEQTWARAGDQIEMVSDPLDVDRLLSLSETQTEWSGIDPRTDIGHIHLQVSDLSKAEEFYHNRLGFEVTQRTYPGALFFAAGGYHHHIGANVWSGRNIPRPPEDSVGLSAFSIIAPNADAWKSATDTKLPASNQWATDPDGNRIELMTGAVG